MGRGMRILGKESGKIAGNPVFWGLTVAFLAANLLLVYGYVGNPRFREQAGRMHDIILEYGLRLEEGAGNDELWDFYGKYVADSLTLYDDMDMTAVLEGRLERSSFHPTGAYRDFVEGNYRRLQERVEEIRDTGEGAYGFYPGAAYRFHSLLFGVIGRRLLPEMAALMLLCVLYAMDYERIHGTWDLAAATRTGRKVVYWKIAAGMGWGLMFCLLLAAGTYGYFFACVPFRGLWKVPVCSAVLAEPRIYGYYPFITFWRLTVGGYLGLTLLVYAAALLAAGGLAAALQMRIRNGYFTFVVNCLIYLLWFQLCFWNTDTFLDVVKNMNLSALWVLCGGWFMEHEMMFSFAGSEFWCVGVTAGIASILFLTGGKRLLRLDIR